MKATRPVLIALALMLGRGSLLSAGATQIEQVPLSTQLVLDAAGETGREAITAVMIVACPKAPSKGTGFVLRESGVVVTNAHVVETCSAEELVARSSLGKPLSFKRVVADEKRDLALVFPRERMAGGLELASDVGDLKPGQAVAAWGYPLNYNGPAPLLVVGYLSGFKGRPGGAGRPVVDRLIVNGAFNPGNSGGPVLRANDDKVIGIVVSKPDPMPKFLKSAMETLSKTEIGVTFDATNEKGEKVKISQSQIIAEFLEHVRKITQVVIGEAVPVAELRDFLREQDIEE